MGMLPASRPQMTRAQIEALAARQRINLATDKLYVVGVRGYYRDTMGVAGANDRGVYDDALFLVTPDWFGAFNGNTDPSRFRAGVGTGTAKGIAMLVPGLYRVHRFDIHNGKYMALCERAGPVRVMRDGSLRPYEDVGSFGINIHRGGDGTTSSLGCQTIPPSQWTEFYGKAEAAAKALFGNAWRSAVVPYLLVDKATADASTEDASTPPPGAGSHEPAPAPQPAPEWGMDAVLGAVDGLLGGIGGSVAAAVTAAHDAAASPPSAPAAGDDRYLGLFQRLASAQADPATVTTMARSFAQHASAFGQDGSKTRIAEFVAQISNETGGFTKFTENLNYSAERIPAVWPSRLPSVAAAQAYARNPEALANKVYGDRGGNRGEASGDGWRYRGRGALQLTFRDNYRRFGELIGVPLEEQPDLAADPAVSVLIALQFFKEGRPGKTVNDAIDRGDFREARRITNGGALGLEEVAQLRARALAFLGGE